MADFEELEKRLRDESGQARVFPAWLICECADAIRQLRQERDEARAIISELKKALIGIKTTGRWITACEIADAALARLEKESSP